MKAPQTLGTTPDQVVGLKALARFIVLMLALALALEHEHEHECDQLLPSNN